MLMSRSVVVWVIVLIIFQQPPFVLLGCSNIFVVHVVKTRVVCLWVIVRVMPQRKTMMKRRQSSARPTQAA